MHCIRFVEGMIYANVPSQTQTVTRVAVADLESYVDEKMDVISQQYKVSWIAGVMKRRPHDVCEYNIVADGY